MKDGEASIDAGAPGLDALAEDFVARYRNGELPAISDYIARSPELADQIRELFPALLMMEDARPPHVQEFGGLSGITGEQGGTRLDRLGDYRILREVGRGGMGIVYEAEQESLGRHVALKVLPAAATLDTHHLTRFQREARAAARLHHTNIVPVFGVGEHDGLHYYVMQFIQGLGLDDVLIELKRLRRARRDEPGDPTNSQPGDLTREGGDCDPSGAIALRSLVPGPGMPATAAEGRATHVAEALISGQFHAAGGKPSDTVKSPAIDRSSLRVLLTPSDGSASHLHLPGQEEGTTPSDTGRSYWHSVASIGVQVADALAYAHSQGVLHRDIKPSNLLLDNAGTVWVTDFGLAKASGSDDLTHTGDIVGTLRYLAPERLRGQSDQRSDIYGLGVTLYELLTFRPPFEDCDRNQLMHRIAQDDPARPRFLEPVIPRDLETIVLKAIDKEPDRRYGSGADMADDLRRFLTDRPIQARRFGSAERLWRWCRRNPSLSVLTAAVILLAAALGAGMSIMHFVRVERDRAVVNLTRALEAEKAARHSQQRAERTEREVKIRAHLTQAVAYRNSGQPGRRYKCLEELRQAVLLDPSDELRAELRDEAIAAMAVVDLRAVKGPDITGSLVAFDPLNQRYAFLDEHGKVHVRRVGDLYDMSVLPPSIAGYMFSPNGQYLGAYTSDSGTTQIWDVESGKPVFAQPLQSLGAPSFSPDERAVAVSLLEGSVAVHELPSGRELGRVHTGMVPSSIAFHPDGQQVAMGLSRLRTVRIWDWQRGSIVAELPDIEGTIHHLAWDAEGRRLALALALGRAEIWDVATRERLASLEGHGQDVVQVAFNPAGLIETWSWDGHTRVWDAHTMRQLIAWPQGVLLSHSRDGRVLGLGFSSQNNQPQIIEIITGSEYRTLSSSTGAREATYRDGPASVYGDLLAVPMGDGVRIWELSSGNELALLPTENAGGTFFSRDGTELITSGLDGIIRWPIERDSTAHTVRFGPPHNVPLPIHAAHNILSLDGRTVGVCGDPPHKGFVVDLPTETVASTLEPHQSVNHVAVSGDGQWATSYGWHSNTVKVWEARTGRLVKEFEVGARAIAQFSRDNTQLIISRYADFSFYEVGFWRLIRVLPREYCPYPGQVAFSPDGSVMALELSSAVISLADTATGRTVAKLTDPHRDRPRWMEFTPDGRRLVVVASYAKAIHVWELGVIGEQLAAMDLDCDRWPASTPSALSACESVSIAVDLGEHSARIESQRNERQAQTHYDLAFAHAQSKRFAQAISEYNRAIELSPDNSSYHNNLAWLLATCDDPTYREESLAVEHAQRAVELLPNRAEAWNTLGVVYYRAGRWRAAIDALVKAEDLNPNVDFAYNAFFLAMAHWRLSESETAGDWFDRAVAWMEKNRPHDEELRSFRAEAEALIKH